MLTLARARDRLLERIFENGLSPDLDLPAFLRFTGSALNDRLRIVRENLTSLDLLGHALGARPGRSGG